MVQQDLYTTGSSVQSQMTEPNGTLTVAEADNNPDHAKRRARDRATVEARLRHIKRELSKLNDFWRFGATTDLDYRMAEAEMEALRLERDRLKEILGDL